MCRFRVNRRPIRQIFCRFQNVPASCERSLNCLSFSETYATTLKFDHKHEERMKSSDDSAAAKLLNELIRDANDKTLPSTASRFAELVFSLRLVNERGFGKLLRRFESCFAAKICDPQKSVAFW